MDYKEKTIMCPVQSKVIQKVTRVDLSFSVVSLRAFILLFSACHP